VPSFQDDYDSEVAHSSEENAVDKIRRQFISVWKMSQDELVDLMVNRVLYKNGEKQYFCVTQINF
ncbi:hypothetical protein Angca_000126, partial [Angiostrongylus cantonensis]